MFQKQKRKMRILSHFSDFYRTLFFCSFFLKVILPSLPLRVMNLFLYSRKFGTYDVTDTRNIVFFIFLTIDFRHKNTIKRNRKKGDSIIDFVAIFSSLFSSRKRKSVILDESRMSQIYYDHIL